VVIYIPFTTIYYFDNRAWLTVKALFSGFSFSAFLFLY